ncbi:hypothetical protein EJB05_31467, partial [Eragrostis curvula]
MHDVNPARELIPSCRTSPQAASATSSPAWRRSTKTTSCPAPTNARSSAPPSPPPPKAPPDPAVVFTRWRKCVSINSSNYGYATSFSGYGGPGRSSTCSRYVTDAYGTACPGCGGSMTKELEYVSPAGSVGVYNGHRRNVQQNAFNGGSASGFVQGVVTYTVRDDLTVTPIFAVTNLTALKEVIVHLDYAKGVEILRASLQSKTVLTDVFLGKQGTGRSA